MHRTVAGKTKATVVVLLLLVAVGCRQQVAKKALTSSESANLHESAETKAASATPQPRVYPYSVVPGGVHSVQDFSQKPDSVAREHYKGLRATKIVENRKDGRWYVSYRKNGSIYWTRKQMTIPAGEKLVQLAGSDKILYARTRCGNLLSNEPQGPTLAPAEEKNVVAEADQVVPVGAPAAAPGAPAIVPYDLKAALDLPVPAAGIVGDPQADVAENRYAGGNGGVGGETNGAGGGGYGGGEGGGSGSSRSGESTSSGAPSSTSPSGANSSKSTSVAGHTGATSSGTGFSSSTDSSSGSSPSTSTTGYSSNTVGAGGDPGGSPNGTPSPSTNNDPTPSQSGQSNLVVPSDVIPVPEPSTYWLILSGVGATGFVARRKKHGSKAAAQPLR